MRGNRSLTALKSYIDWLKPAEKFDGFENQVISEKPSEVAISAVEVSKKKMVHRWWWQARSSSSKRQKKIFKSES